MVAGGKTWIGGAVVAVLAIITITSQIARGQDPVSAHIRGVEVPFMVKIENPDPLPDVGFRDGAGNTLGFDAFAGRVVLVNFWATWCAPCIKEMPDLDALAAATADDAIAVVAINEDRQPLTVAPAWLKEQGLENLDVYADEGQRLARAFGIRGMPTTILIGPDGTKLAMKEGIADWADPDFITALRALSAPDGPGQEDG